MYSAPDIFLGIFSIEVDECLRHFMLPGTIESRRLITAPVYPFVDPLSPRLNPFLRISLHNRIGFVPFDISRRLRRDLLSTCKILYDDLCNPQSRAIKLITATAMGDLITYNTVQSNAQIVETWCNKFRNYNA